MGKRLLVDVGDDEIVCEYMLQFSAVFSDEEIRNFLEHVTSGMAVKIAIYLMRKNFGLKNMGKVVAFFKTL